MYVMHPYLSRKDRRMLRKVEREAESMTRSALVLKSNWERSVRRPPVGSIRMRGRKYNSVTPFEQF